jgi:hypothetical protein
MFQKYLLLPFVYPEDGDSSSLQNAGIDLRVCYPTTSDPRQPQIFTGLNVTHFVRTSYLIIRIILFIENKRIRQV